MKSALVLLAAVFCSVGWAQNAMEGSRLMEQSENRDMALSIPSLAVVEAIDEETQRVRIDGHWYRLSVAAGAETQLESLTIEDLRPGQEVMFQTDGTVADRGNEPLIFRIWSN